MILQHIIRKTTEDTTPVRIGHFDLVRIDGLAFTLAQTSLDGVVLNRDDATGRAVAYTNGELRRLSNLKRLQVDRDHYRADRVERRLRKGHVAIGELAPKPAARFAFNSALVSAVNELHAAGKIKFTEESVKANLGLIRGTLLEHLGRHTLLDANHARPSYDLAKLPSASHILKMRARHARHGETALLDEMARRGGKGSPLDPEVQVILWQEVQGYMNRSAPPRKEIHQRIKDRVTTLNKERLAACQADPTRQPARMSVRVPCRATVSKAIGKLDRCAVVAAREGEAAARKKFRPVASGLQATDPLGTVIIDEHKLDVITYIEANDWRDKFTDEQWEKLGFESGQGKDRGRFLITTAICAATRCIVGMTITPTANAAAALRTLEMILSDKGVWADAVGSHSPWNQCGTPGRIVTDCGSAFRSERFRVACADLGITLERTIAGVPEMRGACERVFRTVSAGLCLRLAGHTFGDIFDKGDRDPSADVSFDVADLAFALVRWTVDVYHNTPHEGLGGETPAACWRRLSDEHGVVPSPDMERFRMAFGVRMSRVLGKTGVTILGVRYHSEPLALEMARCDPGRVDVRWHPEDIGTIAVRIGEAWHTVPAVVEGLDGVHAASWLTAVKDVRVGRHAHKETDYDIVREALAAIDARNADAMLVAGVTMDDWTEERIARNEAAIFQGWTLREPAREAAPDGRLGRPVRDLPDAPAVAAPARTPPHTVTGVSRRLEEG